MLKCWNKITKIIILLMILFVFILPIEVYGSYTKKTEVPSSIVVDRTITNTTTGILVYTDPLVGGAMTNTDKYVARLKGSYLYVSNGKKIVARIKYSSTGCMKIKLPKQKAGTILKFYFKHGNIKSEEVLFEVKDINSITRAKYSSKICAPKVNYLRTDRIFITGHEGTDVLITTDKKIIKKIHFDANQKKLVKLSRKYDFNTKYIFTKDRNNRSKVIVIPSEITIPEVDY